MSIVYDSKFYREFHPFSLSPSPFSPSVVSFTCRLRRHSSLFSAPSPHRLRRRQRRRTCPKSAPLAERRPRQPHSNLYNWSPPRGALRTVRLSFAQTVKPLTRLTTNFLDNLALPDRRSRLLRPNKDRLSPDSQAVSFCCY